MSTNQSGAAKDACDRAIAALQCGDVTAALRHYEYAQRLAPSDGEITLAIGAARLSQNDPRSTEAFALVANRDDVQEAWLGLAAAHHAMREHDLAAQDLRELLSRHGHVRGTTNLRLHDAITSAHGGAGWCSLSADGHLRVTLFGNGGDLNRVVIRLDGLSLGVRPRGRKHDGEPLRAIYPLPEAWHHTRQISVGLEGRELLGSPLDAYVIRQVEGFVTPEKGGLSGWAWFPHDPDRAPVLTIQDARGTTQRVIAVDPAPEVQHAKPLARPRRLDIAASRLRTLLAPIAVQDAGGRHLYGSPLDPLADQRSAAGAAELARRLFPASCRQVTNAVDLRLPAVPADIMGVRRATRGSVRASSVAVVIPVFRGHAQTLACIDSVLASLPTAARCIVVEDASPETKLVDALSGLAERGHIVLRRQPSNRGFPATANAGIRAAGNRDVILLNSDTLVPPGWAERLADAAYSASDIGTATPFSNDASVFSYPRQEGPNPVPQEADTLRLDRLARRANGNSVVEVPSTHGFCVYLRRDCVKEVGLFREDLFAQGYGEENDFCIRARHLGWRHVAVPGLFVAHAGAGSFGSAKAQLLARNLAILNRLHPGYDRLIASFRHADPLTLSRFRMDALRWRRRRSRKGAVILITHARSGGVKRRVAERCDEIAASGVRPIVLAPVTDAYGRTTCGLADGSDEDFPNLRFDTANGLAHLKALLRGDKPTSIELHHFIGHDPAMLGLANALDVPYDVVVHDYAWVCPRVTLVGPDKRYCGEPGGDACEACYSDIGGNIDEDIGPSRLRLRSQTVLIGARRIVVPSHDVAARLRHYFPEVTCVVTPWEGDALPRPSADRRVLQSRMRVVVVGAIGIEKGYEYLLACARHAATHRLALEFVVVGHTSDDKRLLETGTVHITGRYEEDEAVELIRSQGADLGFLPALWPETWSYTLTQLWQAGLDVVAFDLGAPAERIRATRRGSLLPLGLPPAAVCRTLLDYRTAGEATRTEPTEPREPVAIA
ncbi:MAG: glycosyltransferase [Acetobacteraceae bacterium]